MKFIKFLMLLLISGLTGNVVSALNPSRTYKQNPDKYNMNYKEFKVKTNDGQAELNVWKFTTTKVNANTSLVLMAHNGEGNMGDYLRRVDAFLNMGHHVVTFDYRGFGESSDFEIDNNMAIYPHFIDDLESVIEMVWTQTRQPFNLYGWGIGAGLSLGVGYNRPEVKKIIADTPFLSMEDLEERFSSWDEPMEVPFAGYEKRFEPVNALTLDPPRELKGIQLILGSNDVLYNLTDMKSITGKRKNLFAPVYVVENPDRKDNFIADKAGYTKIITGFLNH